MCNKEPVLQAPVLLVSLAVRDAIVFGTPVGAAGCSKLCLNAHGDVEGASQKLCAGTGP